MNQDKKTGNKGFLGEKKHLKPKSNGETTKNPFQGLQNSKKTSQTGHRPDDGSRGAKRRETSHIFGTADARQYFNEFLLYLRTL